MATCNDCLHLKTCEDLFKDITDGWGVELPLGTICNMFIDRSRIVELPCKLGTPVFVIGGKYRAGRFERWINPGKFRLSDLKKMGKTVFLTHEEAEKALDKMEVES